ncbi:hypothetical protein [Streptomyces sp. NPDC002276]
MNGTERDKPHKPYHAGHDDVRRAGTAVRLSACPAHETAEGRNVMEKTVVTSDPQSDERESVKTEIGITIKF